MFAGFSRPSSHAEGRGECRKAARCRCRERFFVDLWFDFFDSGGDELFFCFSFVLTFHFVVLFGFFVLFATAYTFLHSGSEWLGNLTGEYLLSCVSRFVL